MFKRQMVVIRKRIMESSSSQQSSESESSGSSSKSKDEEEIMCEGDLAEHYALPKNSQNRVGRWTQQELGNLKLAMNIFGDQSWKKIQQFLIQREQESKKSKTIVKDKPTQYTYRSVKAIQSKIYQIKQRVESELEYIKSSFVSTGSLQAAAEPPAERKIETPKPKAVEENKAINSQKKSASSTTA